MHAVNPALEAAGARYLVRGGAHKVYEGDWEPRRIVLLEFPSLEAFEGFYNGPDLSGPERDPRCVQLRAAGGRGRAGVRRRA
jgi:uncharacterized protein (DUF1330 family)